MNFRSQTSCNEVKADKTEITKGTDRKEVPGNSVDVLILGGGLAGLGAALTTKQSEKCSYLLLEAQLKAGGRANTMTLQNREIDINHNSSVDGSDNEELFVDAGAQWLHGKHNQLYDLAKKYDLLSSEQSEEGLGAYLCENGDEIDSYFVKKIDFLIGEILGECEQYARIDDILMQDTYPRSVEHFLREKFQQYLKTIKCPNEKQLACNLFDWHLRFQVIDNSCLTLDHVSAKFWGKYSYNGESCQDHYNFRRGFSSAIESMCREIDEKYIHYNKEVLQISVHQRNGRPSNERISVKCSDGSIYHANHVLVTFSLGVLKQQHAKMFHPSLPSRIERAINDIGFQTINKLFIQFDRPWWGDLDGIQVIFKSNNLEVSPVRRAVSRCDDDFHLDSFQYNHWTRHLTGFDVMKPGPSNTLLGWVGGQGAIDMEEMSDEQIIDDCMALLSQFTRITIPAPIRYYW